ncbi:MAG: hypothetical protein ACREO9_01280, partial [Lysobacterales bacterium]
LEDTIMAGCGATNFGGKFFVSTQATNDDLTISEFEGLSYEEVPNLVTSDPTGVTQNVVSDSTWDRPVVCKGKGEANAGDPNIEFQDTPSAGMDLMNAAAAYDNTNNYAFKFEWVDDSVEYNRGLVTGPQRSKGGNEDFKHITFTLGLQQPPEIVEAPSV